jgi:Uma2 family endonuclease
MAVQAAQAAQAAQAPAAAQAPQAADEVQVRRRRFTVAEYYRMAEAGILGEDDRVELIEGEILVMSPIGSRHAAAVGRLNRFFSQGAGTAALVRVQDPIHLGDRAEPQPDIALVRPRDDFYAGAHPGPEDVLLLVEVADTSLRYDRLVKVPLYARMGIREVWVVDLDDGSVEVHRQPSPQGYGEVQRLRRGQRLAPLALPEVEIAVEDLLG